MSSVYCIKNKVRSVGIFHIFSYRNCKFILPGHFSTFVAKVQFYMISPNVTGVAVAVLGERSQQRRKKSKP